MADKDRLDTDEDSADESPRPRRRNPNPAPFSMRMVPHAANSAERAKSAVQYREKTDNERNRKKPLPRSSPLPRVSLFRADGFYGTSSLFDTQSSTEFSDGGIGQSELVRFVDEGSSGGLLSDEAVVEKINVCENAGSSWATESFDRFKTPFSRNIKYGSGDHDRIGSSGASDRFGAETEEASNFSAAMDGITSSLDVDTPSTSTQRASTSPPCKRRRSRIFDPRQTSHDSGFESWTTSHLQQNMLDYELEEEFTSDSLRRAGSVSVYEIVDTDGPEIIRVETASSGFAFGAPVGDCETSQTFGSSGKPAADVWQNMPVFMLNSDMSVDYAYQHNPPAGKQADEQPDADSASKIEMTPDESNFPMVGADSPETESEEFDCTQESASTAPDSGRSVIVDGPTTDAVESDSCISEMENCVLFDTGVDDWFDEGDGVDLASRSSVSAMITSEVGTLDSDEKRDGTPSVESDRTSSERLFSSTLEASNATEQRSAQRWPVAARR